jgi:predicted ATPase
VAGIARNAALSSEAAADIVERADGIPLFVEELRRAVLEAGGSNSEVEKALARAVSPSAALPAALHAPLMARLDRVGQTAKEIAQIAAVSGREFSHELLAPVAERSEAELQEALGRLVEAGLVFSRGIPPHATYLFKHAPSETPPMAVSCAAAAKSCTAASPPCLKPISPTRLRRSRSFSRST